MPQENVECIQVIKENIRIIRFTIILSVITCCVLRDQ